MSNQIIRWRKLEQADHLALSRRGLLRAGVGAIGATALASGAFAGPGQAAASRWQDEPKPGGTLRLALAHEPDILFLDEPTAGVDVELRRDMWALVRALRDRGTTIILTTHYIDEAEEMADRIGVIDKGALVLVEEKTRLMRKLGRKQLTLHLPQPLAEVPAGLSGWNLVLAEGGTLLEYEFHASDERVGIPALLRRLEELGIGFTDLNTRQSSLEDIFVGLVSERAKATA